MPTIPEIWHAACELFGTMPGCFLLAMLVAVCVLAFTTQTPRGVRDDRNDP